MKKIAVNYHCYGTATPLSLDHNAIPSIAVLRHFNPSVDINILYFEAASRSLFEVYAEKLGFGLIKLDRVSNNQMAYRPLDMYKVLTDKSYDIVLSCDIDVMWNEPLDEFIKQGSGHGGYWTSSMFNNGLFALTRNVDKNFMAAWGIISHLLVEYQKINPFPVEEILRRTYHSLDIHDESAFAVLRTLMGGTPNMSQTYFYPWRDCYTPSSCEDKNVVIYGEGLSLRLGESLLRSIHFMSYHIRQGFGEDKVRSIGRLGLILSVSEYYTIIKYMLGESLFTKLTEKVNIPERQSLKSLLTQWRGTL